MCGAQRDLYALSQWVGVEPEFRLQYMQSISSRVRRVLVAPCFSRLVSVSHICFISRDATTLMCIVVGLPTDCVRSERYENYFALLHTPHPKHAHMWCQYTYATSMYKESSTVLRCELACVADMESQQRAALRITGWTHAYAASCSAAALESPKRPAARANSMMRKGRRTRNRGAAGARGLRWGVPANASSLCGVCAGGSSARVGETCGGVASGEAPAEAVCGESHCA